MAYSNSEIEELLDEVELVCTSVACPEQYDAHFRGGVIGYLRLRHGRFTVDYLGPGGDEVYMVRPEGDGAFEHEERDRYLRAAKIALLGRYLGVYVVPDAAGPSPI